MTTRVQLPTGCYGLDMPDGTKYTAKPGQSVTVEDRHAGQITKSSNANLGIISGSKAYSIGTRTGRRCTSSACGFLAQAWSSACPRCGSGTTRE